MLDDTKEDKVVVEMRLGGTIEMYSKDKQSKRLKYKEIVYWPERKGGMKVRTTKKGEVIAKAGKQWKPPQGHPWRKFRIGTAA